MFDARFYSDSYDLYRLTVSTSNGGVQTLVEPGTATATAQSCHYNPRPGRFVATERGIELAYDATILVPPDRDLRPTKVGEQADRIKISSRSYTVLIVWDAAGRGFYKRAFLEEVRT